MKTIILKNNESKDTWEERCKIVEEIAKKFEGKSWEVLTPEDCYLQITFPNQQCVISFFLALGTSFTSAKHAIKE